jgi:hypothetical protein
VTPEDREFLADCGLGTAAIDELERHVRIYHSDVELKDGHTPRKKTRREIDRIQRAVQKLEAAIDEASEEVRDHVVARISSGGFSAAIWREMLLELGYHCRWEIRKKRRAARRVDHALRNHDTRTVETIATCLPVVTSDSSAAALIVERVRRVATGCAPEDCRQILRDGLRRLNSRRKLRSCETLST